MSGRSLHCPNGQRIARALDKKYILTTSPHEPLVHIQNNFTDFFLMMPSTKLHKSSTLLNKMTTRALDKNYL